MNRFETGDYALNKHSGGIVYRFADGIAEITLADYLAENPGKTESDFRKLKELSDADYLERDRAEFRQTWKDTPLDALADIEICSMPSPETEVIDVPDEAERETKRAALGMVAWGKLTEIQRRRYLMHHVKGLSTRKIADVERVSHVAVVYSLDAAEKKIKKYLRNF